MLPKSTSGDLTVAHTPLAAHYPRPEEYNHIVVINDQEIAGNPKAAVL